MAMMNGGVPAKAAAPPTRLMLHENIFANLTDFKK